MTKQTPRIQVSVYDGKTITSASSLIMRLAAHQGAKGIQPTDALPSVSVDGANDQVICVSGLANPNVPIYTKQEVTFS